MAFRFELNESFSEGVRRIACEQIDLAIGNLKDADDPHLGIHQTRKCLKRLRALLRLVRPALRESDFKAENKGFRDIARSLARVRDTQAMTESVAKIENGAAEVAAGAARVRAWTEARRGKALQRFDGAPRDAVLNSLREARRRLGQVRVKGGVKRMGDGLGASYRGGRRAFADAYGKGRDEDFHELRKRVQQHWRHVQLLEAAWPDALKARAELARDVSQLLGDDQDISMLIGRLREKREPLASEPEVRAFLDACQERRAALRASAEPRLERLFMERPRAFRERMTMCWRTARDMADTSKKEVEKDASSKDGAERGKAAKPAADAVQPAGTKTPDPVRLAAASPPANAAPGSANGSSA